MLIPVLWIDFETQHADPKTTPVTEVAAILTEINVDPATPWEHRVHKQLETFNHIVYHPGYPPQTPEIVELTGLDDELLKTKGRLPKDVFSELLPLAARAQIAVAHNKKFDQTVFESVCTRLGLPIPQLEWICTLEDLNWPKRFRCKQLSHLAFDHGMKMDHRDLHRALDDVTLLRDLVTTFYDFAKILEFAREPWVYLAAKTRPPWEDGGESTGLAKAQGFSYERAKYTDHPSFPKTWVKRVKSSQVEDEIKLAKFPVAVLK